MDETNIFIKPLNDKNTTFIIGDSPTVTFNENVTVYAYPRIEYKEVSDSYTQTQHQKQTLNLFKKIVNKLYKFRI